MLFGQALDSLLIFGQGRSHSAVPFLWPVQKTFFVDLDGFSIKRNSWHKYPLMKMIIINICIIILFFTA